MGRIAGQAHNQRPGDEGENSNHSRFTAEKYFLIFFHVISTRQAIRHRLQCALLFEQAQGLSTESKLNLVRCSPLLNLKDETRKERLQIAPQPPFLLIYQAKGKQRLRLLVTFALRDAFAFRLGSRLMKRVDLFTVIRRAVHTGSMLITRVGNDSRKLPAFADGGEHGQSVGDR